ncbi:MAG TPA: hypothetical protein VMT91_03375 [Anaerolineales bacterium]|nr:hypothetical protein [Anaerolineales bacterium]
MEAVQKTQSRERKEWLRRFNRKVTNPLMMTFAGKRLYTVVAHVGRHSKKPYQTPLLGRPSGTHFYFPLPYGADTDWCLNVLAAGGCTARWNGRTYTLAAPRIVDQAAGEPVYPGLLRWMLHASGVQKYLVADICATV